MSQKIWVKTLQNHEPYKWFDWIKNKTKTVEARIFRDDWTRIYPGDFIVFKEVGETNYIVTRVISLQLAYDFGHLHSIFKTHMFPINDATSEQINQIYGEIYNNELDRRDIEKYGVVGVYVDLIQVITK